ncbi:MAG: uroporphyrinogen-III C-methyltransferase [Opitutales bacterium]
MSRGRVTLVGAGPGAVDLITLRGQRALAAAEVVVYDDLANPELLDLCPETTRRIYVGKRAGLHLVPQDRISAILIEEARQGRVVVRLKGGDPLIFGRGGEELQALAEAGIPCEVVPGITAAMAAGAGTGIPLTHRDQASAVVFVTGHECAGKPSGRPGVDWAALARTGATLCIYMGVRRLPEIAAALQEGGLSSATPVAVVANATLPSQHVHLTTLAVAPALSAGLKGQPALIIVGEVVRWAELQSTMRSLQLAG